MFPIIVNTVLLWRYQCASWTQTHWAETKSGAYWHVCLQQTQANYQHHARNSGLLRQRIIIWKTTPQLIKGSCTPEQVINRRRTASVGQGEKRIGEKMSYEVCVCLGVFTIPELKSVTVAKILIWAQAHNDGKKNWVRPQAHSLLWCLRSQQNLRWRKLQRVEKMVVNWVR